MQNMPHMCPFTVRCTTSLFFTANDTLHDPHWRRFMPDSYVVLLAPIPNIAINPSPFTLSSPLSPSFLDDRLQRHYYSKVLTSLTRFSFLSLRTFRPTKLHPAYSSTTDHQLRAACTPPILQAPWHHTPTCHPGVGTVSPVISPP